MGCECLKPEEMQKEIRTYNIDTKDNLNYMILKTEKIKERDNKDFDIYINSLKTSDKNTFNVNKNININTNNDNNKIYFKSEKINEKINTSKNNSNEETAKKTLDNKNIRNRRQNKLLNKKLDEMNKNKNLPTKIKKSPKTLTNLNKTNNLEKLNVDKNKSKTKLKKQVKIKKEELPQDEFSKYIYEHINTIRADPQSFIPNIEEAKKYITRNKNNKLIYKKNIKVTLSQGVLAFEEAISILKMCKPMDKLIFEPYLVVKLPESEEDILDKNYFKNEIKKKMQNGIPIHSYWRDIIKEKETSFLMMIIDDTGLKAGLKRKDILDPNMKYIGICSTNIGKHFVCFLTFSN